MSVIISRRADVYIRWLINRDMPAVLDIENDSFPFAWTREDFRNALRQRNCMAMVAEIGDQVAGFMIYELHRNRLEILNLAVHRQHRRSGVGSSMIAKLYGKLSPQRRTRIVAAVCERNEIAHYWLKACGFTAVVILRDHYEEIAADAYLFRLTYGEAA